MELKIINMFLENLLAKSHNQITLLEHLTDTAEKSFTLSKQLNPQPNTELYNITSYIVGLFHDVGKISSDIQKCYQISSDPDKSHTYIGAVLFDNHCESFKVNGKDIRMCVLSNILNHHPKISGRKFSSSDISEDEKKTFDSLVEYLIDHIMRKFPDINIEYIRKESYDDDEYGLDDNTKNVPYLQDARYNDDGQLFFHTRNILVASDIYGYDPLRNEYLSDFSYNGNISKPNGYDNRFDIQKEYSEKFNDRLQSFEAGTGFGKTMTGLLFMLRHISDNKHKRGWWILPHNNIAETTYINVTKEIDALGLSDIVSVALLLGGKYKKGSEDSDIIVTNVDNFASPLIKSNSDTIRRTYGILNDVVIFDEYHEYVSKSSLMSLFVVIGRTRDMYPESRTLYMSATSEPGLLKKIRISAGSDRCHVYHNSKNDDKNVRIHYIDNTNVMDNHDESVIFFTHSISKTQKMYDDGFVDLCFHTRFTDNDKEVLRDNIVGGYFGKNADGRIHRLATTLLTTGADISCNKAVIFYPLPNRTLQILGRVNRWFNENVISDLYLCFNKNDMSERCVLNIQSPSEIPDILFKVASEWMYVLKSNYPDGSIVSKTDLMNLRNSFTETKVYKQYIEKTYKESVDNLESLQFEYSGIKDDCDEIIIPVNKRRNFRSDGCESGDIFVTMMNDDGEYITPVQLGIDVIDYENYSSKQWDAILEEMLTKNKNRHHVKNILKKYDGDAGKERCRRDLLDIARNSATPFIIPSIDMALYDKNKGVVITLGK